MHINLQHRKQSSQNITAAAAANSEEVDKIDFRHEGENFEKLIHAPPDFIGTLKEY